MDKIKPQDCVAGKWYYCEESNERLLCVHTTEKAGLFIEDANSSGNVKNFVMSRLETFLVTPLPDCTGWDWVAPPKYRPFKDAWEFVRVVNGRDIRIGGIRRKVASVDFVTACDLVVRFDCEWLSLHKLVKVGVFADTGEPCGVKL
jgi:hypothetical protein